MQKLFFTLCLVADLLGVAHAQSEALSSKTERPNPSRPPEARIDNVETDYFGTKVADPYRWMEKGPSDPDFLQFLHAQNTYTRSVLAGISGRDALLARIHALDTAVTRVSRWQRVGSSIFYSQTAPDESTASLMVRDGSGKPRRLLDPKSFQKGKAHAAIDYFAPSWDAKYVAVGVELGGSEDSTIHLVETATGRLLPDAISRTQYGGPSWLEDSHAFAYARLQKLPAGASPTEVYVNQRVYLHIPGTDPEKDAPIFGPGVNGSPDVDKAGFSQVFFTPGSSYAFAYHSAGTTDPGSGYICPVRDLEQKKPSWKRIYTPEDGLSTGVEDSAVTIHGSTAYLVLDKNAPNGKLIAVALAHPDIAQAKVVVPESDEVLAGVYAAKDALYLVSRKGVNFNLRRSEYGTELKWSDVTLPFPGTISQVNANTSEPGLIFALESWTKPAQAFSYDPEKKQVSNTDLLPLDPADFSKVESREVMIGSTDGAKVPVTILLLRGLKLDGSHPAFYDGYGAYGVSINPRFFPPLLAWIERGGVFAVAHVRGGGEFGEAWHNAGRKDTKKHTVDDMLATARYLISQGYTSPARLAVQGTSAGGISVGGAIVRNPELFAAAIDNVGDTDLLRFQQTQGGAANIPEFGDVTEAKGFHDLYTVSPYHHVKDGEKYPAVLGITGVNDPRVPSWQVAKMLARLTAANASDRPMLLRVDFDAGHGFGSTREQREQILADTFSFALWQSGDSAFRQKNSGPSDSGE